MGQGEAQDDFGSSEATACREEDAELVERFAHRVDLFAGRLGARFGLGSSAEDELVSAGFWGLFQAIRNRRPDAHPSELSAYVSRRIEGAVFDEARRLLGRARRTLSMDPVTLEGGVVVDEPARVGPLASSLADPEHALEEATRWDLVDASLSALEEEGRALLVAYASGDSVAELARCDGSSPGRLQARMTRLARSVRARSPELRRILRHEL